MRLAAEASVFQQPECNAAAYIAVCLCVYLMLAPSAGATANPSMHSVLQQQQLETKVL